MAVKVVVKKSTYRDSITLMKISDELTKLNGVSQAASVMATDLNKKLLEDVGFIGRDIEAAGPDDLLIGIQAKDSATLEKALSEAEKLLSSQEIVVASEVLPRTLDSALKTMPDANLAVISVPGNFAKREAMKALENGLNVFLFSSNVAIEDEIELKALAKRKHLLMMGPDCGTAIINGVVLGFGNVVRRGSIGLVSASGTGLQQVSTLVHREGLGISQAIGTGGNDLHEEIRGITMLEGIRLLDDDDNTRAIVLISKPPGPKTTKEILRVAEDCRKPVVVNFLGITTHDGRAQNWHAASTLEEAVKIACEIVDKTRRRELGFRGSKPMETVAKSERSKLSRSQKYVRGLFSGGTLCYETQVVLSTLTGDVFSNTPLKTESRIGGMEPSRGHTCIDMGSEEFVVGRAHPMIDFSLRKRRILKEAEDPEAAVILLDVVLGYGANPDPAGELVPSIIQAKEIAKKKGRFLSVVASVVGTPDDPQNMMKQEAELRKAGVIIMPSNAQASRIAGMIATGEGSGATGSK